ncbi:hypothetical protein EVAR_84770_1 [Eumeta japonica]|uniref:Uncharacterized protein n=1 Tax=Eumeta variegata TaxID=151549 RepID=A0A4C1U7Y6_EUMVA|nr:hypothetical protein EVAR_84770_1 [Eumeta japonica]
MLHGVNANGRCISHVASSKGICENESAPNVSSATGLVAYGRPPLARRGYDALVGRAREGVQDNPSAAPEDVDKETAGRFIMRPYILSQDKGRLLCIVLTVTAADSFSRKQYRRTGIRGANELASHERVGGPRRPWTFAIPEESPMRCRPLV